MQNQSVRYIKVLGISLCIGLVIVGLINWAIDPYDELGKNWIGVYTADQRQQAQGIVSFPHDAVIIGSSRTEQINPDDLCGYKFYNASFPAALPEEMYYYIDRYIKNEKLVVIGLDFYMFNESSNPLLGIKEWPARHWSTHEYLLGWNVLIDSIKAIYNREYLHQVMVPNGYHPIISGKKLDMATYQWWLNKLVNQDYANYHLSEVRLQYMRNLKKLLDERHLKYIVFVNPMQEDNWKVLHLTGTYGIFLQWINSLKEIFPDLQYFPEGQYSQRELYLNNDPSHYSPVLGETFMNVLTGCQP
jgi:hypothetical protein